MTAIVWFRRDLRVHDHPALRAALAAHDEIIPLFVLDDRLLRGRHASGPRTRFMLECLQDLDRSLRERGGGLVVRRGRPERVVAQLASHVGAAAVYARADVTPFAARRDAHVEARYLPGLYTVDDVGELRTQAGAPYSMFSPFHRAWLEAPRHDVLAAPRTLRLPRGVERGSIPSVGELGLESDTHGAARGGESGARERLKRFLEHGVERYADARDDLGADGSSRLSPYLRFGCLSPREVEERLPQGSGAQELRRQLAWRDFYAHVLLHNPRNATEEHQERYRGTLDWEDDDEAFDAWRDGRTGYPLVDAGMRQLRSEGWMHNRARLVVGSFLVKYLGIDWRRGERHFMRWLIDGDEASNNGNWQWIASVGVDPQPFFRRMYNPARQMESHDPRGDYVRRHVPELRDVPDEHLREPWEMPEEVQRECGCVIGEDYPAPIVDREAARRAAFARYRSG